ncbi:hypothetical protein SVI_3654 [Shewanella violacea DSS12]|uniref:Uncharacterized protein n=1 Tax=Shewanella violacea (strain JCM 10179 / CIP 106290 / LMG 19151 / DSS12) TaxID=637905 RepID=D4ZC80_SHEVD|nr:hypothetical protein SVI_3654 [Shewanella violacea DSS12]
MDAAVGFGFKDETAERIGTYLQRPTEVAACEPAASNKHQ